MPTILIFGSSSGLGLAAAQLFSKQGWQVISINRAQCDLASPESVKAYVQSPQLQEGKFDLCLFAAGMGEMGYLDELGDGALERSMAVNFHAPVTLFKHLASRSNPCTRFIFVLSGTADLLFPGLAPYALSKRALRDYLTILKAEGSFAHCHFLAVNPGSMNTPFNKKALIHGQLRLPANVGKRTADEVAEKIFQAVQNQRTCLNLSPLPYVLGKVQALFPLLISYLLRLRTKRLPTKV